MSDAAADGGEPDPAELWEQVGRGAVTDKFEVAWLDVDENVRALLYGTLYEDESPSAEQVEAVRDALNRLRFVLEDSVAPAAGVESWEDIAPYAPIGDLREYVHCDDENDGGEADE